MRLEQYIFAKAFKNILSVLEGIRLLVCTQTLAMKPRLLVLLCPDLASRTDFIQECRHLKIASLMDLFMHVHCIYNPLPSMH